MDNINSLIKHSSSDQSDPQSYAALTSTNPNLKDSG